MPNALGQVDDDGAVLANQYFFVFTFIIQKLNSFVDVGFKKIDFSRI